jgi:hypothetical protein
LEGVKEVPLVEPTVEYTVGLEVVNRDLLSPLVAALKMMAGQVSSAGAAS